MFTDPLPILISLLPLVFIVWFFYYLLKNASSYEKSVLTFIGRTPVSESVRKFFEQDKLANFSNLFKAGKTIAAANEYKVVMDASLDEARLAVKIIKTVL